ncbi:hypothetical protein EW146_g8935 [Bondarzewia mesenterica]|uniref:Ndc10 domain-containing protein n=1 Tax=Bondarzewia mesenterica TaxID=1095465 RepID=A0A4S4LC94_9AGAM|nr:hypothetical protein EW146_g8935 [Bondarzewia mesenterica]
MGHGWKMSTLETYRSSLLIFHVVCDCKRIGEDQHAPAHPDLLLAFLATLSGAYMSTQLWGPFYSHRLSQCIPTTHPSGSYSASTLSNYLSGVRAWHLLHGLAWSVNANSTAILLCSAAALAPPGSKRRPRSPYTVEFLVKVHQHLNLALPLDAAVWACATSLFYGVTKTGELTTSNLSAFLLSTHITHANVSSKTDRNDAVITVFFIPTTKAAPQGEDIFWAKQNGESDPEFALRNHFEVNDPAPVEHLFAYSHKGTRCPLSCSIFIKRIHDAAKASGQDALQCHGFQIGGTLKYLLCNIPFDVVKSKGHWASDAFTLYLRRHAEIMAPWMQANLELHGAFIRYAMPHVR